MKSTEWTAGDYLVLCHGYFPKRSMIDARLGHFGGELQGRCANNGVRLFGHHFQVGQIGWNTLKQIWGSQNVALFIIFGGNDSFMERSLCLDFRLNCLLDTTKASGQGKASRTFTKTLDWFWLATLEMYNRKIHRISDEYHRIQHIIYYPQPPKVSDHSSLCNQQITLILALIDWDGHRSSCTKCHCHEFDLLESSGEDGSQTCTVSVEFSVSHSIANLRTSRMEEQLTEVPTFSRGGVKSSLRHFVFQNSNSFETKKTWNDDLKVSFAKWSKNQKSTSCFDQVDGLWHLPGICFDLAGGTYQHWAKASDSKSFCLPPTCHSELLGWRERVDGPCVHKVFLSNSDVYVHYIIICNIYLIYLYYICIIYIYIYISLFIYWYIIYLYIFTI